MTYKMAKKSGIVNSQYLIKISINEIYRLSVTTWFKICLENQLYFWNFSAKNLFPSAKPVTRLRRREEEADVAPCTNNHHHKLSLSLYKTSEKIQVIGKVWDVEG